VVGNPRDSLYRLWGGDCPETSWIDIMKPYLKQKGYLYLFSCSLSTGKRYPVSPESSSSARFRSEVLNGGAGQITSPLAGNPSRKWTLPLWVKRFAYKLQPGSRQGTCSSQLSPKISQWHNILIRSPRQGLSCTLSNN
jgi:hypothetical protein